MTAEQQPKARPSFDVEKARADIDVLETFGGSLELRVKRLAYAARLTCDEIDSLRQQLAAQREREKLLDIVLAAAAQATNHSSYDGAAWPGKSKADDLLYDAITALRTFDEHLAKVGQSKAKGKKE